MTKKVRIENADAGTNFKPVVQVWDKTAEGPVLASETILHGPCDLTGEGVFLTSSRFIVIKEEGTFTPLDPAATNTPLPGLSNQAIARVCHEVNRAYCEALGDNSQPAWEDAPQWQRDSALLGVDLHLSGDHGPEASHESWSAQKIADGWKYGPVKDPEAKEHPCLVPFSDLPREQQAKDFLFRAVVKALR